MNKDQEIIEALTEKYRKQTQELYDHSGIFITPFEEIPSLTPFGDFDEDLKEKMRDIYRLAY